MIRHLYRLWPRPALLIRLSALHILLALLQGALLGLLIPILRALLRPEPDMGAAGPWLIAAAAGLAAYALLTVLATPVGFAASMELGAQLRHHLMQHVTTLPLGWFSVERKARLARAITADVSTIAHLTVTIGAPALTNVIVPATIVLLILAIDWRMALLFLAIAPAAFFTLRRSGRIASSAEIALERAATEIAGRAIELGQAQTVLRAAGHGATGGARLREALDEHREVYRRGLRRSMGPDLTYTGVVMAGFAVVLLAGARLLLGGSLPLADTIVLLVLAVRFLEPLGALIELIGALRAMDNAIARVEAILWTPALPAPPHPVRRLDHATIELTDASYSYGTARALSDVTFTCRPGTTTALVGPSGSGKTTVTRLIARFFDVDAGRVCIGGVDVRDIHPAVLMQEIAIVFQDVYLFDTTIEENLRIAQPGATAQDLSDAACAARLDEVVARLPDGWQTRVGEGGAQLSGGERQRVSIARAFLKRARIVLIDEAGSALDPENERAIGDAIARLTLDPAKTVIVIAHRPATLAAADQVIALDGGRVVERGTPAMLRHANGIFAHLYAQYEQARGWRITARPAAIGQDPAMRERTGGPERPPSA